MGGIRNCYNAISSEINWYVLFVRILLGIRHSMVSPCRQHVIAFNLDVSSGAHKVHTLTIYLGVCRFGSVRPSSSVSGEINSHGFSVSRGNYWATGTAWLRAALTKARIVG